MSDGGHGTCLRDSQGNYQPGGWTHGNPLAQCDTAVSSWEEKSVNAGEDGAQEFDVPDMLRAGSAFKWSEATYEESVAACRKLGYSTESGQFYDQCKTAESLVGDAWEALGCGSSDEISDYSTVAETMKWSQQALLSDEEYLQTGTCPGCYDMASKMQEWKVAHGKDNNKWIMKECTWDNDFCQDLKDRYDYNEETHASDNTWVSGCECGGGFDFANSDAATFKPFLTIMTSKSISTPNLATWADSNGAGTGAFDSIPDDTAFIYTYGFADEVPTQRVDKCRTNVEAEILKAGNTIPYTQTEWESMRGAVYSSADSATKTLIKAALDLTDKLTCSGDGWEQTAAILASDIDTCVGGSTDCSQCVCAKRETWKKFPAYCPEKSPRKNDYPNPNPLQTGCTYTNKVDLLETVYPFMDNAEGTSVCEGNSVPLQTSGYYYVNPASGYHKLLKFEQCLDVTFDWLYGEKEVTEVEHQNYLGDSKVATIQHNSGESLLQELYAEQIQRVGDTVEKYYAKLNGKWTGTSDARLGAFSASDVITSTTAYSQEVTACNSPGGSSMRWTRKPGWHKSELRYVAWMEPDGQRTSWGLWQHYVKCELAESHRAATLYADGQHSSKQGTFWEVESKETTTSSGKSYWERVGENVRTSSSESRTWNISSSSSHYSHTSLESHKTITGRTHCVWIDGTCVDQWHIRCLDYYYMCSALQQRAEAAYLEWRFFRENECDAQEKCLTNGADLPCNAAYSADDDAKKKDSQMYKCSETCAIEHENAKAREADIETAERLRCMLEALFGKPSSSATIEKGGAGTEDVGASCSASAKCKDNLSCQSSVCVALDQVWTLPAGNARSQALAACNVATYDLTYWNLKQEECPSWAANCAGVATRAYWSLSSVETNKEYGVWIVNNAQSSNTLDPAGLWREDTGKWRKNCGTKLTDGAEGLCKTECATKRSEYADHAAGTQTSTEFWASWSTIYTTCSDEHFLTTGLWNTHDVCHLTVFDHDNTKAQIADPRMRQAEGASSASSTSTYVASCYDGDSCSNPADDEYSVQSTTWGKFAFDFCDGGTLNLDARDQQNSGISVGRKALHYLGWDNMATSSEPDEIFSYAWHTSSNVALKTWSVYSDSVADNSVSPPTLPVLCTDSQLDESWTPVTGLAYDGLTALSQADCWRERAKQHVVDDEFGPANCKITN